MKKYPIIYLALALALGMGLFAATHPLLATDAICRQAPMAEAFAAGDWINAFRPRFGLSHAIFSGSLVYLTGLDGLAASCFAATIMWALCIIPIFGIAEQAFDKRVAWFSVILFILCPQTLLWALKGLLEPFKMLGVLLAVEALLKAKNGSWWNCARMAVGFLLMSWTKNDGIILLPCFGLAYAFFDHFRAKTWTLAGATVLLLQPLCWLVYEWNGVWVPATQYIDIWRRLAC